MITSIHTLIYSDDPPATRAFLRDVLGWPYVEHAESDEGFGLTSMMNLPGAGQIMLYQPQHPLAYDL